MARRKKGRDISGWLVIDKPAGISSNAVVNKVRWAFDARKAGHAGTLDPEATGVLAIALGEATKTVPYVTDALKAYEFVVRLGQATNTDDTEGEIIGTRVARPTDEDILAVLPEFVGEISQVPPKYSAVKIDGERAYARVRSGEDVSLSARTLFVESLTLLDRPDADHLRLELVCGKGGYVRSVARDLGETLECLAHVKELRRIWSGPFEVDEAVAFRDIESAARTPALDDLLQPLEIALADMPELRCSPEAAARLRHGNPAQVLSSDAAYGDTAWASCGGHAIAVGIYRAGELHPSRVFNA